MGRWKSVWRAITARPPADPTVERKHSAVGGLAAGSGGAVTWLGTPNPTWTPRTYATLAVEGYRKNVIAFRSVRMVSEGAASVPWTLFDDGRTVAVHPLLDLLDRPNPLQGGNELFETFFGHLLIAGNAYLEAVTDPQSMPRELYALRPDRMKVVPGPQGWPVAYLYSVAGRTHRFIVDIPRGETPILQLKSFNPLDDLYGLSPIEAAASIIRRWPKVPSSIRGSLPTVCRPRSISMPAATEASAHDSPFWPTSQTGPISRTATISTFRQAPFH